MVRSRALVVPMRQAQSAREELRRRGNDRPDLKIRRRDGEVWIPVSRSEGAAPLGGRWEWSEFDAAGTVASYKDVVRVPEGLRDALPTSFDVVGDVAIVKVPDALGPYAGEIGRAMRQAHPHLRAVFADEGVQGPFRVRALRVLAGSGPPRTVHREFGVDLEVDLSTAYFSPRLAGEHARVAALVGPRERVLDATAGVGPYAVAMAKRNDGVTVEAVDANTDAVALLDANVRRHKLEDRVRTLQGDGFQAATEGAPWDRIVVNLPHGQEESLAVCAAALAPGGTLHATRVLDDSTAREWIESFAQRTGCRVAHAARVHPYSAISALYAFDLVRGAPPGSKAQVS